jgi:hypothetical protein
MKLRIPYWRSIMANAKGTPAVKAKAIVKKANAKIKAEQAMPRISHGSDKVYVVSTMANAVSYNFHKTIDNVPRITDRIILRGGAGLPSQTSGFGDIAQNAANEMPMWTPQGMVTPIRRDRFNKLKDHWLFKKHLERGYVVVRDEDITQNYAAIKQVVTGMETDDPMAPLNQARFARLVKSKMKGLTSQLTTNKDSAAMDKIDRFG